MQSSYDRGNTPVAQQQQQQLESPVLPSQRQHSCPQFSLSRNTAPVTTTVPATLSRPPGTPLWSRQTSTVPLPPSLSDSLHGVEAPLLLSRSIRETTLLRVEGGLSRAASSYAASGDDTDDARSAVSPVEMPELAFREPSLTAAAPPFSVQRRGPSPNANPHLASPASASLTAAASASRSPTTTALSDTTVMNFESLWSNIDRYLFAVYTTLQTGDESSLRPLRTPRHRMGWYTVIYNACSGDPAKSRELYARLALLLLHLLESHVLFPVLQNVDHSRVQFLTGVEESVAEAGVSSGSIRLNASVTSSAGGTPNPQHSQPSSGSFPRWGKLKSIAIGSAPSNAGASRSVASKDASRNSSFRSGATAAAAANTSTHSGPSAGNSSFAFMRRLFQSSHHNNHNNNSSSNNNNAASPLSVPAAEDTGAEEASGPAAPIHRPAPTRGRFGWSFASGPGTPLQKLVRSPHLSTGGDGGAAATSSELRSAFEGFDSAVGRRRSGSSANVSPHSASPATPAARLTPPLPAIPTITITAVGGHSRTPTPTPPPPHQSGVSGPLVVSGTSSTRTLSPTTGPNSGTATAPPSAVAQHRHQHARVASQTGRVLVNDEEEVLCEANTVPGKETRGPRAGGRGGPPARRGLEGELQPSRTATFTAVSRSPHKRTHTIVNEDSIDDETDNNNNEGGGAGEDDDDDDASLRSMNSSLSSVDLRHRYATCNEERMASNPHHHNNNSTTITDDGEMSQLTGGSATAVRCERRTTAAARGGRGADGLRHGGGGGASAALADDGTEDSTAAPSARLASASSTSLMSLDEDGSDTMENERALSAARTEGAELPDSAFHSPVQVVAAHTTATTTARETFPAMPDAAVRRLSTVLPDSDAPSPLHQRHFDDAAGSAKSMPTASNTHRFSDRTATTVSRQDSSTSGPGSSHTGRETAVPVSPTSPLTHGLPSPHESPLFDGTRCSGTTTAAAADHAGAGVYGGRRFSLCYTFIQEWQTFLVFRGVVMSCFRYLDQYYTRRYGMDTITLMCFKVFYVAVYEPLHPLLVLELRYLTRYIREVYEATGQVAWEQLELVQATYNIMAELLVIVQSTSSAMVAQHQPQQKQPAPIVATATAGSGGGIGCATVTNTTSTVPQLADAARSSRTSSRARSITGHSTSGANNSSSMTNHTAAAGLDSNASSVASTPRMGSLDPQAGSAPTAAASGGGGGAPQRTSQRRRGLFALFSSKKHSESAGKDDSKRLLRPVSPGEGTDAATQFLTAIRSTGQGGRRSSPSPVAPHGREADSAAQSGADGDDGAGLNSSQSQEWAGTTVHSVHNAAAPPAATVVVDLRGTVALRDRLEGHTSAHHLTTQALKQWEGLAADRRLRNGTIVKETAQPLATIVMEDIGNDYVAGIFAFYRVASAAHRATDDGRRSYVEWALGVKEMESQVWSRVQLPFLHTAIRAALNDALVVEQHRSIVLDGSYGLRPLLEAWSASLRQRELELAPQRGVGEGGSGGETHVLPPFPAQPRLGEAARDDGRQGSSALHLASAAAASRPLSKHSSEYVEAPIKVGLHGTDQHFLSSFPHRHPLPSASFELMSHSGSSRLPLSAPECGEDSPMQQQQQQQRESSWQSELRSAASLALRSATAAVSGAAGDSSPLSTAGRASPKDQTVSSLGALSRSNTDSVSLRMSTPAQSSGAFSPRDDGAPPPPAEAYTRTAATPSSAAAHAPLTVTAPDPALGALKAFYSLFSDVSGDECFVLMAAVLVTAFIRDAADLFEAYVTTLGDAGTPSPAQGGAAPPAAQQAQAGVALMAALADLIERYTQLVETVFQGHPTLAQALRDGVEEIACPTRWTRKGALQAAQQRAQEVLMASAAAEAAAASPTPAGASGVEESAQSTATHALPSVLLSRDARHATAPLVALAEQHPVALQQLRLSVLLARYADTYLQHESVAGRVVSGAIVTRLRLIGQLVSLVEDKDTFLEHYRLCLARRLLGSGGSAGGEAPLPSAAANTGGGGGRPGGQRVASLNVEAERQLVGCLQSYLGASATHAFEAMLRDYEGTQRTRDAFEQEPAYAALAAKIRVQLITSAQWPMYALLPLQPHVSLREGMEAFRSYYARLHPSRTLLWVFSLGTATLTAEVASGTKQVVASTLLATLLLVVSDACNAAEGTSAGTITGAQIAQTVGMPFHLLRTHLHLLSQHRAFNLLRWIPVHGTTRAARGGALDSAAAPPSAMNELDAFTLNPHYTHKLRKIRLPLPKTRLTGLPASEAVAADTALPAADEGADSVAPGVRPAAPQAAETEDAVVSRHVTASRRVLLDASLIRVFKSRRVVLFEELFQTVTAQLSRQFVPTRRDVKAQLEGLIDRDYVARSPEDANAFVYVS